MNYAMVTEKIIEEKSKEDKIPTLLLHSCCAPCSTSVIEYLSQYFYLTVFYYNPNIMDEEEYRKRLEEQKRFIGCFETPYPTRLLEGSHDKDLFLSCAQGLEDEKEGGVRCFKCYRLRMDETAKTASKEGYDFFGTTLTVSPLKNAAKINEIGSELEKKYNVAYLYSDFKKKEGYKRSIELSNIFGLYRQNYCGCNYSKRNK